ncbi:MAG: V-type ATP synthase subunit D [Candidatus Freyarchaeota archaeon]|nr:V-type ATP synthase subunit D [Candidatus Jordarchaeia archaeon]MBS7267968.1 V-type ATP synthase subunit D [Candidatus Jordarchaeia archaeon]MBS7280437.1 V-type ATP synthase subunit D [Candidatus Jordarchaeia archaeon]
MIAGIHPTRMELLILKRRRSLAEKGHDLLKEKRDALIMEFFDILEDTRKLRSDVNNALKEAYEALAMAKMVMGPLKVEEVASGVPPILALDVSTRNVMGVRVPLLRVEEKPEAALISSYGFTDTSAKLDEAVEKFRNALKAIIRLAETEAAVKRLAEEIEKTKRRVNALKYIIIPRITNTIKFIELHLEEREREDLFRMKRIKSILASKAS